MNNQILRAYSIKEVSKKINIPTGTIRQWEKDLEGLLVIPRTQQGARYYTENEIKLIKKIKEMRNQNVGKEMIRSLLEESINRNYEPVSEPCDSTVQPSGETSIELVKEPQKANIQEFYAGLEMYKQELLQEFRKEMLHTRNEIISEIKDDLAKSNLQTIKELSKSIQRSNDKRKAEVQEISDKIIEASEHTSETFETLSKDIVNHSEVTFERLFKQMDDSAKTMGKDNKNAMYKVTKKIKETQNDIKKMVESFDVQQECLIESLNEIKQSAEEIQQREEVFQALLVSHRQAAATKNKKNWWKLWS